MQPDHKLKQRQQNLKNSSGKEAKQTGAHHQQQQHSSNQQPGHSRSVINQKLKLNNHSSFSKKHVLSTKKKKVLCETTSVVTTTTPTTSSLQTTKLLKDHHHHQVPRKKIKVSQSSLTGASVTTTMAGSSQRPLSSFLQDQSMDSQSQQLTGGYYLNTTDLDLFVGSSSVSTSDIFVDDSLPCCSKSILNYHHQKSSSSLSNSSCSLQSSVVDVTAQTTQLKITNFLPVKKLQKARKTKFGKDNKTVSKIGVKKQKKMMSKVNIGAAIGSSANTNNINNPPSIIESVTNTDILLHENLNANLTANTLNTSGSKLLKKKKRTLKTETPSLKIKKSRCKRLLH